MSLADKLKRARARAKAASEIGKSSVTDANIAADTVTKEALDKAAMKYNADIDLMCKNITIVDKELCDQAVREHFGNKPIPETLDKKTLAEIAIRYNTNKAIHENFCKEINACIRETNYGGK